MLDNQYLLKPVIGNSLNESSPAQSDAAIRSCLSALMVFVPRSLQTRDQLGIVAIELGLREIAGCDCRA